MWNHIELKQNMNYDNYLNNENEYEDFILNVTPRFPWFLLK